MRKVIFVILCFIYFFQLQAQNIPLKSHESYFLYQKTYPKDLARKDWFPNDWEIQGVTNDGKNWFFVSTDQQKTKGMAWRIPKNIDLDSDVSGKPGVFKVELEDVDELADKNFWHWGDPDHIRYDKEGDGVFEDYILIPMYDEVPGTPRVVACFNARNLTYINYAIFDAPVSAGWCAVGTNDKIYAGSHNPTIKIYEFNVAWDKLTDENESPISLSPSVLINVTEPNGNLIGGTTVQGGEFSNSGEILYLVTGRGFCAGKGAPWTPQDGIHAIETTNWTRIEQSKKSSSIETYFSYDYNPECIYCFPLGGGTETPQGLTVWDLEDDNNSKIRGGLHVLVDRYIFDLAVVNCPDRLSLYHYSSILYVDKEGGIPFFKLGTPENPFQTINEAYQYYGIWDGAIMEISEGVYDDKGVYEKRILMRSKGGPVIIGKQ